MPLPWALPRLVQPVTSVDDLLRTLAIKETNIPINNTGYFTLQTVPKGKRWDIFAVKVGVVTGTYTFTELSVSDPSGNRAPILFYATSQTFLFGLLSTPFPVDQLNLIQINVDTKAVNGDCNYKLMIKEENAYY